MVDHPTDTHTKADYFSNVALVAAKAIGKAPREVALQLHAVLEGKIKKVESIEVAGPGIFEFSC